MKFFSTLPLLILIYADVESELVHLKLLFTIECDIVLCTVTVTRALLVIQLLLTCRAKFPSIFVMEVLVACWTRRVLGSLVLVESFRILE